MLNPRRAGVSSPHSCSHCKAFVVYLYDEEGYARSDLPIWHRPNPSQNHLAQLVYGDIFWTPEWDSRRLKFYSGCSGVSFFGLFLHEMEPLSRGGCSLARRFIKCLPSQHKTGENYAVGVRFQNPYSVKLGVFKLKRLRWDYLPSEDGGSSLENWYTLLAEKGSPVADIIKYRSPNPDPGEATALSHVKGWMEDCLRNHDDCKRPEADFKPTRLVQISRVGNTTMCRLRDMSSMATEPYAALSYCWGGDQPFKTTTATLPQYLERIDLEQLPRTLQDAVYVTQELGLHHVWIDALCIVQDSAEDKTREIGLMARVYSNAAITIAASRANTVWDGFLHERPVLGADQPDHVFSMTSQRAGQNLGPVTLAPITFEKIDPLDTRGWTFQERVLSSRIIGFGTLRSHFTCQASLTELHSDGWSDAPLEHTFGDSVDSKRMADLIAGKYPVQEMLSRWLNIVEGFTMRGLQFMEDKIPAIAGLAERFGELTGDQYCAGLWRKGMPQNLLWYMRLPDAKNRALRPETTAPSWSWAAVKQPVIFTPMLQNGKDWSFIVDIEDCRIEVANESSPYGAIKGGALTINTLSRQAKCFSETGLNYYLLLADPKLDSSSGSTIEISFFPDNVEKEFANGGPAEIDVYLLLFGTFVPSGPELEPPSLFGMVVREVDGCPGKCSRLGLFRKSIVEAHLFEKYVELFYRSKRRSFVVI